MHHTALWLTPCSAVGSSSSCCLIVEVGWGVVGCGGGNSVIRLGNANDFYFGILTLYVYSNRKNLLTKFPVIFEKILVVALEIFLVFFRNTAKTSFRFS